MAIFGIHIDIDKITRKEKEAAEKATAITNQIKALLLSKEVITLEKLTGTEELGEQGIELLNKFIAAINSEYITNSEVLIKTMLGGLGANLTGLYHEGCVILHGIQRWIHTFEVIFHLNKDRDQHSA